MSTSQRFDGVPLSGELIRRISAALESWSTIDDQAILATYRPVRSDPDLKETFDAIERGEPANVRAARHDYVINGREYNRFNTSGTPMSFADLAAWIDDRAPDRATLSLSVERPYYVKVFLVGSTNAGTVTVECDGFPFSLGESFRSDVPHDTVLDAIANVVAELRSSSPTAPSSNRRIFLGHGHGSDWKILEDKIRSAGFEPHAFESSVSAGAVSILVVDAAIRASSAAVLYLTPDDLTTDGHKRARQNVVHEVGYAQGALGVSRVIVVQNEGVEMPSNLDGVTVVRVATGALYDKLDEVVAYLERITREPGPMPELSVSTQAQRDPG